MKAAGGRQLKAPSKKGEAGAWAVAPDSVGAPFALWQPAKAEAADYRGVVGSFCWNELYTDDPAKAVAFYEEFGGLKDAPMDMGPMGTYHVLKSHGKSRGGIAKSPKPGIPPHWVPYVQDAERTHRADRGTREATDAGHVLRRQLDVAAELLRLLEV